MLAVMVTVLSEEFIDYASFIAKVNANSPLYKYLCFFKLIESIFVRQRGKAKKAKAHGEERVDDIPRIYLCRERLSRAF